MTIPIRNLYYLFLYSWSRYAGGYIRDVGVSDAPDLPNLFSKLLAKGSERLISSGLDRDYVEHNEETAAPRGRLEFNDTIKRASLLRGNIVCEFDEFTHDILHNQIIKSTLQTLAYRDDVEKANRHELREILSRFSQVSTIRVTPQHFRRVRVSRNSSNYLFLMRLCEFVFWAAMPDERGNHSRFESILEDEVRMSAVFEDFLRNFYRIEQSTYSVAREQIQWDAIAANDSDLIYLPTMNTDITLRSSTRTLIIDAKYYTNALGGGRYTDKLRSAHLYQLMTYLQHEREHSADKQVEGMLIYPELGKTISLQYQLLGIPVKIASIDLSAEWKAIANQLHSLI